eukprot:6180237-Pleurochrysis_carterae.AAC.1
MFVPRKGKLSKYPIYNGDSSLAIASSIASYSCHLTVELQISAISMDWSLNECILVQRPIRCSATAVALRVAARQRGACLEASYQRQIKLTKRQNKQPSADDLQAEKEPSELSSLYTTRHDVN